MQSITYPRRCLDAQCAQKEGPARSVFYGYEAGKLDSILTYASFDYSPGGLLREIDMLGSQTGVPVARWTQERDSSGLERPGSITFWSSQGSWPGPGSFQYDGAGNVTTIGDTGRTSRFVYDTVGRLRSGTLSYESQQSLPFSYTYDRFGNLRSIVRNGSPTDLTNGDAAALEASNRLPDGVYTPRGALSTWTTAGGDTFAATFDPANRLRELTDGSSGREVYLYNAADERVATLRTSDGSETFTLRGPDQQLLAEYEAADDGTWSWLKDYIYGGSRLLATEGPEGRRFVLLDHLGSTRSVVDDQGVEVARSHFYPFGMEAPGTVDSELRLQFTGHERETFDAADPTDDLDYQHARFFSPVQGRFTSPDEVLGRPGLPQTWNRYAYVLNNPLLFVDPDGRQEALPVDQPLGVEYACPDRPGVCANMQGADGKVYSAQVSPYELAIRDEARLIVAEIEEAGRRYALGGGLGPMAALSHSQQMLIYEIASHAPSAAGRPEVTTLFDGMNPFDKGAGFDEKDAGLTSAIINLAGKISKIPGARLVGTAGSGASLIIEIARRLSPTDEEVVIRFLRESSEARAAFADRANKKFQMTDPLK